MYSRDIKIVVSGDICVNLLLWRTQKQWNTELSWQSYPYVHNIFKSGGAMFLKKLVSESTGLTILSPQIKENEASLNGEVLLSTVELELFQADAEKRNNSKVYRVNKFLGFTGPITGEAKLFTA